MLEARSRGFDNCIVCDVLGNVAELANSNVFMAKDGVVFTPMPNGAFLNGITRQRVIKLMRADGISVVEQTLRYNDFETADEIFATGNASKVMPVTRIGERALQPGPMFRKARELYWAFAHGGMSGRHDPRAGAADLRRRRRAGARARRAQEDAMTEQIYASVEGSVRREYDGLMQAIARGKGGPSGRIGKHAADAQGHVPQQGGDVCVLRRRRRSGSGRRRPRACRPGRT